MSRQYTQTKVKRVAVAGKDDAATSTFYGDNATMNELQQAFTLDAIAQRIFELRGLRTDTRRAGETQYNHVNSMIQGCLAGFTRKVDDIVRMLG